MVQTGPKSRLGGVHTGRWMREYHPSRPSSSGSIPLGFFVAVLTTGTPSKPPAMCKSTKLTGCRSMEDSVMTWRRVDVVVDLCFGPMTPWRLILVAVAVGCFWEPDNEGVVVGKIRARDGDTVQPATLVGGMTASQRATQSCTSTNNFILLFRRRETTEDQCPT